MVFDDLLKQAQQNDYASKITYDPTIQTKQQDYDFDQLLSQAKANDREEAKRVQQEINYNRVQRMARESQGKKEYQKGIQPREPFRDVSMLQYRDPEAYEEFMAQSKAAKERRKLEEEQKEEYIRSHKEKYGDSDFVANLSYNIDKYLAPAQHLMEAADPFATTYRALEGLGQFESAITGRPVPEYEPARFQTQKAAEAERQYMEETGGGIGAQIALGGAKMLGTAATAGALGVPFTPYLAATSGIEAGAEKLRAGEELLPSTVQAIGSGAITYLTEGLGGIGKTKLGQAMMAKIANSGAAQSVLRTASPKVSQFLSRYLGQYGKRMLQAAGEEALEEAIEYPLQVALENLLFDDATPYDVKEHVNNIIVGGGIGGIFGGGRALGAIRKKTPDAMQQVKVKEPPDILPLPEPKPTPDFYTSPTGETKTTLRGTLKRPKLETQYFAEEPFNMQPTEIEPVYSPVQAKQVAAKPTEKPVAPAKPAVPEKPITPKPEVKPKVKKAVEPPFLPKGEKPVRKVDLPKVVNDKKVSKYAQTLAEAEVTDEPTVDTIKEMVAKGTLTHETVTDKAALSYAEKTISDSGFKKAVSDWDSLMDTGALMDKNQLALGQMIYNQAVQNKDVARVKKMIGDLTVQFSETGRNLQAARLLKQMTPDGRLYALERAADKISIDLKKRLGKNAPKIEISEANAKKILESTNQNEIDAAVNDIQQEIADQVPAAWEDKVNAWRYLSMLGNPRTHIRNILGNALFAPVRKLKDLVGAGIEAAVLPGAKRTKGLAKSKKAVDFAKSNFEKYQDEIRGESKFDIKAGVQEKRRIFNNKTLESLRRGNFNMLEFEDTFFLKNAYIDALSRAITARNINIGILTDGTKESNKQLKELQDYATSEAQKATYRDANDLASWISKQKRRLLVSAKIKPTVGKRAAAKAGYYAVEGFVPFTKTPANIIRRGIEYSPVELLNAVTFNAISLKNGEITGAEYIDKIASGLTGTGLVALGYYLYNMGLITGGGDLDKKKKEFDELIGKQQYAISIGDKTYTVDWAAPSIMPVMIGVEIAKPLEERGYKFKDGLAALTRISEPVFELSMLQGVNRAIRAAGYGEGAPISEIAKTTLEGYAGQFVPTALGQTARTIDPTRRTAYVEKESPIPDSVQRFLARQANKIPFVSKKSPARIDQWGREQVNESAVGRIFQNYLSPGYVSGTTPTSVDKEIERLYQNNKDVGVLPSFAEKSVTVEGVTKNLTASEHQTYAKVKGKTAFDNISKMIRTNDYKSLTDNEKQKAIEGVYSYANAVGKTKVSNYKLSDGEKTADSLAEVGMNPYEYYLLKIKSDKNKNGSITSKELKDHLASPEYTSNQKVYIFNQIASTPDNKSDLSSDDFAKAAYALSGVTGNKVKGETVPGSLKENRYRALIKMGFTKNQAKSFLAKQYNYKY